MRWQVSAAWDRISNSELCVYVCASARVRVRERVRGFGRQDLAARKTKWFVSDLFQRKCVNRHAWQSIARAAQSARAGGQELADEADAAPHNDRRRLPVPEVGAGRRTRHPAGISVPLEPNEAESLSQNQILLVGIVLNFKIE